MHREVVRLLLAGCVGRSAAQQPSPGNSQCLMSTEKGVMRGSADVSLNLTDLAYLALQHGATRPKTLPYEIDVSFEFKKQVRVPY